MPLTDQEIRELFARFNGTVKPTLLGIVKEIDKTENTCSVEDDEVLYLNVRLRSVTGENKGIVAYPKIGSNILCAKVEDTEEWAMLFASEYDSIEISIESLVINGGDLGGLVVSQKVIDEMKKVSDRVNAIVQALSNLAAAMTATAQTPVVGASLGTAINTAIAQILTPLVNPAASAIENSKIKH